ncbi:D-sedoheptulose-7-phosphate isomerase [Leucobacter ruminantium]|uniref:SIS domain-containing protein n=1 Tax=Leucobacter ruminantium TaxID=1289170 RepID=A0A939LTY9_9MICO|nr:SIS domain-containing protein [Leucobacter ruminantium]MBO1804311.1 SIS domain-containing protein [Leucobacter ruminantium]
MTASTTVHGRVREHFGGLERVLSAAQRHADHLEAWGIDLAERLRSGARVLIAGNGGSAAEAQHFAAELVGRYREERPAFSALALNAETSSLTAIGNDYGFAEVFARQVRAHGRAGDIVVLLSTSGASRNLLEAARAARQVGAVSWAMTGPGPNPLSSICDDAICVDGPGPHVQEFQLAAVHAVCEVFDAVCARHAASAARARSAAGAEPAVHEGSAARERSAR